MAAVRRAYWKGHLKLSWGAWLRNTAPAFAQSIEGAVGIEHGPTLAASFT
jgi:hypothetical protein